MKKYLNALLTLALVSGCHSAAEAKPLPSKDVVRLLLCNGALGTAYVIGKNLAVTANHVSSIGGCQDSQTAESIKVIQVDTAHDFALIAFNTGDVVPLKYSCARYEKGRTYVSVGYGHGNYQKQSMVALSSYTSKDFTVGNSVVKGMRALDGTIIAGMSGGPILDSHGVVHGSNNVYGPGQMSFSFELADTPLCANPIAEPLPPLFLDMSSL